jgi:hypothetical protein
MGEEKQVTATIGGAPVSWVALMGALLGGGSIIPLIYYIEGGGFHSLSYAVIAIVACLLGPWGAGVSAFIGWAIAMFLAPGTTIEALFVNYSGPAIIAGLILNKKWKWVVWIPALGIPFYLLTPWYWPGDPRLGALPQPFLAASVWYDGLSFPLMITVGRNLVPDWVRGNDKKKMFFGLMLLHWIAAQSCHLWGWTTWLLFYYPIPAYVVAVLSAIAVPFERVILQVVSGIIGVPLLLSLRKSGLRRIPGAVW